VLPTNKEYNVLDSRKSWRCLKVGVIALAIAGSVAEAHATATDVHDIIDICTSSERILKDYALIGMRIVYHDPQKDLNATVKHMKEEMVEIQKHPLSKKLHEEEVALQEGWKKIEAQIVQKPNRQMALTLRHQIDNFAIHCESVAQDLAKDTGDSAENAIVHIAKLDLDVQELAGDYVMKAWDAMSDEEYYKDVKEIKADYQKEYQALESAPKEEVSMDVKSHLKILDKHFLMFEFMAESHSGRFVPLLIAKKANKIHQETIKILTEEERKEIK